MDKNGENLTMGKTTLPNRGRSLKSRTIPGDLFGERPPGAM